MANPSADPIETALALSAEASALEDDGEWNRAGELYLQSLTLFEAEDPGSPDVANISLALGRILERQGRYTEAEAMARRALEVIEPLLPLFQDGQGSVIQISALCLLGDVLRQLGCYREAVEPLEKAISLADLPGSPPDILATAWNSLGMVCKYAGWFERGADAYRQALQWIDRMNGAGELLRAAVLHNIGGLEHARERFDAAEEPARRAWEIRCELLGEEDLSTLADAVAYAAVLDGLGRSAESKPIYENALAIYERVLGPEDYEVAALLHNLAAVQAAEGLAEQALATCRRALRLKENLLGSDHPDTALTRLALAVLLLESGSIGEAREAALAAVQAMEKRISGDHPNLRAARSLLAQIPG